MEFTSINSIKTSRFSLSKTTFLCKFSFFVIAFFVSQTCLTVFAQEESLSDKLAKAKELYFSGDYGNSINYLKPLATAGDAEAQYYLGLIFKSDKFHSRAVRWD